jgi:hypothetical protein
MDVDCRFNSLVLSGPCCHVIILKEQGKALELRARDVPLLRAQCHYYCFGRENSIWLCTLIMSDPYFSCDRSDRRIEGEILAIFV